MLRTLVVAAAFAVAGCNHSTNVKKLYGAYDVQVSAFGKMDDDTAVIGQATGGLLLFDFAYGFTTAASDPNEAGMRVKLSGKNLEIASQPIHVDYSTGEYDGTVSGTGKLDGTALSMKLDVVPTDTSIGTSLEYDVAGTLQP